MDTQLFLVVGSVEFEKAKYEVLESDANVNITLVRKFGTDEEIQVCWKIIDESAFKGKEYQTSDNCTTFSDGDISKIISIDIISNDIYKEPPNKTFKIQLTEANNGAMLGALKEANITIIEDDDNSPTPPVPTPTPSDPGKLRSINKLISKVWLNILNDLF